MIEEQDAEKKITTADINDLLMKRFPPGEWALMLEVAPATGGGTRYADAIAVNLWHSRGHSIHGFEVKVSRSDWLRELKNPEKAEALYRYCDHWWIIAPRGIVKDGELPVTWGLLEARTNGLVQVKAAPRLEAQPVTRVFFASLMRRAHEQIDRIAEVKNRVYLREAEQQINKRVEDRVRASTHEHKRLRDQIANFSLATGLEMSPWSGPDPDTIKLAQRIMKARGYGADPIKRLTTLAEELERMSTEIRGAVAGTGLTEAAEGESP